MKYVDKIKQVIAVFILFFLSFNFYNHIFNGHYHIGEGGMAIYHAHPYDKEAGGGKTPFEDHRHSNFEFFLLNVLVMGVFISVLFVFDFILIGVNRRKTFFISTRQKYNRLFCISVGLRAPPAI